MHEGERAMSGSAEACMSSSHPASSQVPSPSSTESERPNPIRGAYPPWRRGPKELLEATKPFQQEDRKRSWWHVVETFGAYFTLLAICALAPWWWVRLFASIVLGLVIVRAFILYHDFMHLSILRGSTLAKWIFYAFGLYVLTPPTVWRATHNYHHAHTAKIVGSHVGSYLMVTTEMWKSMNWKERLMYKLIRHPINIVLAYLTVFAIGMNLSPFFRNPRKHFDAAVALLAHAALLFAITMVWGWEMTLYTTIIPFFVAMMLGAYLFYAQHDFPEMYVQPRETWEYTRAALESSSYMEMGPIMRWFTGNIGYHHVHHLNPGIPFYRLPEVMAAIPELQHPRGKTSLHPRDIMRCFSVKLWDPQKEQMVGYPDD
ncbi:MAG: fatty acid desaturase [Sandaracinaceae bacterium]|nr:fatty acid desaturase [Sandaracinaceae bacterium]MDW8246172.1 fatty acid desaturase [Sandaracinaceae bacterium]